MKLISTPLALFAFGEARLLLAAPVIALRIQFGRMQLRPAAAAHYLLAPAKL
jgi:hypothetical protein